MSKSVLFCAFLCAISLILVNGLPTRKENGIAEVQNDEPSDTLKHISEANVQSRQTREAAPQRFRNNHHHHHRGGGGGGGGGSFAGSQAGSFSGGGGRGGGSFTGAQAGSFGGGRGGGGRGGSNAQSESFNFNTPFGSFSGSESSANSFGRRG